MKYEIISKRIKEAMNDKNFNAAKLSERSGVGKSAISHYVNGRYIPHNDNAVALAKALDVNPTWLMGYDVEKHIPYDYSVNLSHDEILLVELYRTSDDTTQAMVDRILRYSSLLKK